MAYALNLITAPATEPLTLAEVKQHCDCERDDQDALFTRLLQAAREKVESDTDRSLINTSWQLWLDSWPNGVSGSVYLPRAPIFNVQTVSYINPDTDTTIIGSSNFIVSKQEPPRIYPNTGAGFTWPTYLRTAQAISIVFVAGYGSSASSVPAIAKQAILLLCGHWYENREASISGTIHGKIEHAYDSLIESLRYGNEFTEYAKPEERYASWPASPTGRVDRFDA